MTSFPVFIAPKVRAAIIRTAAAALALFLLSTHEGRAFAAAEHDGKIGPWEYRWGDSPRDAEGKPLWALKDKGGAWHPAPKGVDPPGKNGNEILWMRAHMSGEKTADPAVYFDCVLYNFEAYHRGTMVYRFGAVSPGNERRFRGRPWHIVPLEDDFDGTYLYLRIYSFDSHIGIPGTIRIASRPEHRSGIIEADFWRAAISLMFLLAGLMAAVLYARWRDDRAILGFASSLILMGLWNIANSRIKLVYLPDPIFWLYAEHASLYLTPVAIGFFLEQLFGRGPFSAIRRGWQALLVCAVISLAVSAFNPYWLRAYTLRPYQVLMAFYLVIMCGMIIREAWRGDIDARIVAAGLAVAIAFALYDIGISFLGLSFTLSKISYWGSLVFIFSLGVVLDRRIRVIPAKIMTFTAGRTGPAAGSGQRQGPVGREASPAITPEIREKLDRVIDYLRGHYTEDISREGLAGLVDMNHDYLGKMFILYTGKKIGAFISELRINMAADLLTSTDRSIVTIAFEAGFESLSTFYRVFQKKTGLSPTAYRERFRSIQGSD
jgi:AraC-like DNA-binding protein